MFRLSRPAILAAGVLAVAFLGPPSAPPAEAHTSVAIGFGFPAYFGPPVYYAPPPPVYYAPPAYYYPGYYYYPRRAHVRHHHHRRVIRYRSCACTPCCR